MLYLKMGILQTYLLPLTRSVEALGFLKDSESDNLPVNYIKNKARTAYSNFKILLKLSTGFLPLKQNMYNVTFIFIVQCFCLQGKPSEVSRCTTYSVWVVI